MADELEGGLRIAHIFGLQGNQALLSANKAVKKTTGVDCHQLLGVDLISPVQAMFINASDVGLQIGLSAIKTNQLLKELGYQSDTRDSKGRNVWIPTELGKKFSVLVDTGKKHGDGAPVQQIKWNESIVGELASASQLNPI